MIERPRSSSFPRLLASNGDAGGPKFVLGSMRKEVSHAPALPNVTMLLRGFPGTPVEGSGIHTTVFVMTQLMLLSV